MKWVTSLAEKVSGHEAWEISKPWVEKLARTAGVKSLYDVPEYFRERFELRGLKVGNKEFGGGLAGATTELLQQDLQSKNKSEGEPRRIDLYQKLEELEKAGNKDSSEYKAIEEKLDASRSTKVSEAITKVNKKLALTKEGDVKNSEARQKMAEILREQRRLKTANAKAVKKQVTEVLDDYTNQKVDGVTAARETLRTAATLTGTKNIMRVANVGLNAAKFVQQSKQTARRENKNFDTKYLVDRIATIAKDQWQDLRPSQDESGGVVNTVAATTAKLTQIAGNFGIKTGAVGNIGNLVSAIATKAPKKFTPAAANDPEFSPQPQSNPGYAQAANDAEFLPQSQEVSKSPQPANDIDSSSASEPIQSERNDTTSNVINFPQPKKSVPQKPLASRNTNSTAPTPRKSFSDTTKITPRKETPKKETQSAEDIAAANSANRIRGADRSRFSKPAVAYENSNGSAYGQTSIDQQFAGKYDGYRSIQPSTQQVFKDNNVQVDPRNPYQRRGGPGSGGIDGGGGKGSGNLSQQFKQTRDVAKRNFGTALQTFGPTERMRALGGRKRKEARKKRKIKNVVGSVKDHVMVSRANMMIWPWALYSWLFFQLPFALLSLAFFGFAYVYLELFGTNSSTDTVDPDTGDVIGTITTWFFNGVKKVGTLIGDVVEGITGINLGALLPDNIWMLTHNIIMAYGLVVMFVAAFIYTINGVRPFFGKGAKLKILTFILCVFGYSTPVLNIFPWIIFWTAAVWVKPK